MSTKCTIFNENVTFTLCKKARKGSKTLLLQKDKVEMIQDQHENSENRVLYDTLSNFFENGRKQGLEVDLRYIGGPLLESPRRRGTLYDLKMELKLHGRVIYDLLKTFGNGLLLKVVLTQAEIEIPSGPGSPDSDPVESKEISYRCDNTLHKNAYFLAEMCVPDKWQRHWSLRSGSEFSANVQIIICGSLKLDMNKPMVTVPEVSASDGSNSQNPFSMKELIKHLDKDAKITSRDNSCRFECSQALLKASSKKLLELISQLREKQEDVVIETNMTKEGISTFLNFLEGEKLVAAEVTFSIAMELLQFSANYCIETLNKAVTNVVMEHNQISFADAITLVMFAITHQNCHLERKAVDVIKGNPQFFTSPEFIQLLSTDNRTAVQLLQTCRKYS